MSRSDGIGVQRPERLHTATKRAVLGLSLLLVIVAALYLMLGERVIGPGEAWSLLRGSGDEANRFILLQLRAPRLVIGLLVGASLGVSGAILQAVVRNPLAAPDIVGVTGGASMGAVLLLTVFPGAVSIHLLPVAAIAGAFIAAAFVYAFAWKGGVSSLRLVLVGIGIASLMSACTSFMLTSSPTYSAMSAYIWLTGTIYGSSWQHVGTLLPWTAASLAIVYFNWRNIHVALLGDELAAGVGSAVQRGRLGLVALSVALAGAAVSIGGVIGFVGLIAPHMARKLAGPVMNRVLPISALIGALVVAAADLVGRAAFLPFDIPVGVFTSAIGAPFFIYLLYRSRNSN